MLLNTRCVTMAIILLAWMALLGEFSNNAVANAFLSEFSFFL